MNLRSLLLLDLSGKLKRMKKKYSKSHYNFDRNNIICIVTEIQSSQYFYLSACAYCDDPNVGGFDMNPVLWFYKSNKFPTQIEAFAYLEKEIRRATKKHPETRFYRDKINPPKDGPIYEYCINGEWHDAGMLPIMRRCRGCGSSLPEEQTFCPECGEPHY